MSARLGLNPIRYESWKGKTFFQITTSIQRNNKPTGNTDVRNFMKPLPVKLYRRELVVSPDASRPMTRSSRLSTSITELDRPNGSTVVETSRCLNGLESTLDMNLSTSKYETGECSTATTSQVCNALRRVRSSGMNKPKYDATRNNSPATYCNDTKQYLVSRNKTFAQNQYHYVRSGDTTLVSNGLTKTNVYSPAGLNHCPKYHIIEDKNSNYFKYIWVYYTFMIVGGGIAQDQPLEYEVNLPDGYYNIQDLNSRLHDVMEYHGHYLIDKVSKLKLYFINFVYNTYYDKIEMQCLPMDVNLYPVSRYDVPQPQSVADPNFEQWYIPDPSITNHYTQVPVVVIADNTFSNVVGFSTGYYPDISPWVDIYINNPLQYPVDVNGTDLRCPNLTSTPYAALSNIQHNVFPMYMSVSYKPSNTRFATQGGVSASSRILREKYDAISTNGLAYLTEYDKSVANAMAYGVSDDPYTLKSKIGYPLRSTPVFNTMGEQKIACSRRKNMYNG